MLEDATIDTFTRHVGEQLTVLVQAGTIEVELVAATSLTEMSAAGTGSRVPFSLEFLGPREPIMHQGTYRFEHPTIGAIEIFIVPIGVDESGARYEAVFT